MTINEKVRRLDMSKEGRIYDVVARHDGVNESAERYIKKNKANIRKTTAITFNIKAKRVVTPCDKRIVKMEAALSLWIADCRKNVTLETNVIWKKPNFSIIKPCPITTAMEMLKVNLTNLKPVIRLLENEALEPAKAGMINSKKGTVSEACPCMVRLPLLTPMSLVVTWRLSFLSSSVRAATSLSKCLTSMKQAFFERGCLISLSFSRMK